MKALNTPYYIAKKLKLNSKQSFTAVIIKIAIATVALSLAIMIISSSVIHGFKDQITDKIYGFWGHIHITDTNINRTFELYPIEDQAAVRDSISNIAFLEYQEDEHSKPMQTAGGVKHIQSFILAPSIIKTKTSMEGIILKGVGDDYSWDNLNSHLKAGQILDLSSQEVNRGIIVSQQTANRLELNLDDNLILNFWKGKNSIKKRVAVKGIYRTGLEEYDKKFAFIDQRVIQNVLNWEPNQIGGYELILDDVSDATVLANYIYDEVLPSNQYAETIKEKFPNIFEWLELQNINESIILILMILVSIINMATALLILILERSQMIGILKSMGETDWNIRKIFIYHSSYIIGIGLLIGNVIGIGLALLQQKFGIIKLDEESYYLSVAPIKLDYMNILLLNAGTILVILIFLIIPSYLVTKVNIIKVLRFK